MLSQIYTIAEYAYLEINSKPYIYASLANLLAGYSLVNIKSIIEKKR